MDQEEYAVRSLMIWGFGILAVWLAHIFLYSNKNQVTEISKLNTLNDDDVTIHTHAIINRYRAMLVDFHVFKLEKQLKVNSDEMPSPWHVELEFVKTQRIQAVKSLLALSEKDEENLNTWAHDQARKFMASDLSLSA